MPARGPARPRRLDPRDRQLLAFLAEHPLALDTQVAARLGVSRGSARRRVLALDDEGYLVHKDMFKGQPGFSRIRADGLAVVGSELPPPKFKLAQFKHDVGLAWLWLAAERGGFGVLEKMVSERRMRSEDGGREHGDPPYAVRLGGVNEQGAERLHYPDLLLVDRQGRRLALELELSSKKVTRRRAILGAYAADTRIDAVLYLVEGGPQGRGIARAIRGHVRQMRLTHRVFVRTIKPLTALGEGQPGGREARAQPPRVRRPPRARSSGGDRCL